MCIRTYSGQVLVDWTPVPAESITELVGDGLTSIVLDANRPEDTDDKTALIRTLRPIKEVNKSFVSQRCCSLSGCFGNVRPYTNHQNERYTVLVLVAFLILYATVLTQDFFLTYWLPQKTPPAVGRGFSCSVLLVFKHVVCVLVSCFFFCLIRFRMFHVCNLAVDTVV